MVVGARRSMVAEFERVTGRIGVLECVERVLRWEESRYSEMETQEGLL